MALRLFLAAFGAAFASLAVGAAFSGYILLAALCVFVLLQVWLARGYRPAARHSFFGAFLAVSAVYLGATLFEWISVGGTARKFAYNFLLFLTAVLALGIAAVAVAWLGLFLASGGSAARAALPPLDGQPGFRERWKRMGNGAAVLGVLLGAASFGIYAYAKANAGPKGTVEDYYSSFSAIERMALPVAVVKTLLLVLLIGGTLYFSLTALAAAIRRKPIVPEEPPSAGVPPADS